jgi:hypothetical protein
MEIVSTFRRGFFMPRMRISSAAVRMGLSILSTAQFSGASTSRFPSGPT